MASATQARDLPLPLEVIVWIVQIAAALLLMPVLLFFTVTGLLYNLLRSFFIPFVLICLVVLAALLFLAPEVRSAWPF